MANITTEEKVALLEKLKSKSLTTEDKAMLLEMKKTSSSISSSDAFEAGSEMVGSLGSAPLVAGAAGAAGAGYSSLIEEGRSIPEAVRSAGTAFKEAFSEQKLKQDRAIQEKPIVAGLGGVLTAASPLLPSAVGKSAQKSVAVARTAGKFVTKKGLSAALGGAAGSALYNFISKLNN